MATTGYSSTGAFVETGAGRIRIHADIVYNVTRTNNTVTFNSTYARIKYVRETGSISSFTYGSGWAWRLWISSGSLRRSDSGSGTRAVNEVNNGGAVAFSVGVGANDTNMSARVGAWFSGDGETFANKTLDIPDLGSPSGATTVDTSATTDTSISVRNDVTSWGANATGGSVRSYIANNGSYSGQTYLDTTDNALIAHTGLTPNTEYWFRGWASNGGGKTAYQTGTTGVTLASATVSTTDLQATEISLTGTTTTGKYVPTTKLQYKKTADATWLDGTSTTDGAFTVGATGLLPSTSYDYRLVVTTTAGTWTGATTTATTLPAAKLILPDGTVKNAIPHVINAEGVEEMVKVKVL